MNSIQFYTQTMMPERILRTTDDILELFVTSGLHVQDRERTDNGNEATLSVCLVPFIDRLNRLIIRRDTTSRHSVQYVVDFLVKHRNHIGNSVKIFSNYSPTGDCCKDLLKLKEDFGMDIEFVFSALRSKEMLTCNRDECGSGGSLKHKRQPDDLEAIEWIQKISTGFRSFDTADWAELIELLTLWGNKNGGCTLNLAHIRYGEKYGELRDKVDDEMARDVQELLKNNARQNQEYVRDQYRDRDQDRENYSEDDEAAFENLTAALPIEFDVTVKSAAQQKQLE